MTTNTLPWIATRYGMSCRISMADFLARLDDGAEQINETTYLWRGWVIRGVGSTGPAPVVEDSGVWEDLDLQAVDLDAVA